jgi:hypothetical protein
MSEPGLAIKIHGKFPNNECVMREPSFWIFGVGGTIRNVSSERNMPARQSTKWIIKEPKSARSQPSLWHV